MEGNGDDVWTLQENLMKQCLSTMEKVQKNVEKDCENLDTAVFFNHIQDYAMFITAIEKHISVITDFVIPQRSNSSYGSSYGGSNKLNQTLEEVPEPSDMFEQTDDDVLPHPMFRTYWRHDSVSDSDDDSSVYFSADDYDDDDHESVSVDVIVDGSISSFKDSNVLPIGDTVPSLLDDTDDSHVSINSVFDEAQINENNGNSIKSTFDESCGSDLVEVDNDRGPSTVQPSPASINHSDDEYIETPPPSPLPPTTANDTMENLACALDAMNLNCSVNSNFSLNQSEISVEKENCINGIPTNSEQSIQTKTETVSRIPKPTTSKKQPFGIISD